MRVGMHVSDRAAEAWADREVYVPLVRAGIVEKIKMAAATGALEEQVKLLSQWASIFGLRVRIALELKGVKYEYEEENLMNKSQELLQANPVYKKIPVLIHNGKPVVESMIILHYIDEAWSGGATLLPKDAYDRAVTRFWADFGDKKIYDVGARLMKTTGEEHAKAVEEVGEVFMCLEDALGKLSHGKPFFGGEEMNFTDVALAPFTCWFHAYERLGNFKIPGPDRCPRVHKWMEAVKQQHAVKKVLPEPEKVAEFALSLRQRFLGA